MNGTPVFYSTTQYT